MQKVDQQKEPVYLIRQTGSIRLSVSRLSVITLLKIQLSFLQRQVKFFTKPFRKMT